MSTRRYSKLLATCCTVRLGLRTVASASGVSLATHSNGSIPSADISFESPAAIEMPFNNGGSGDIASDSFEAVSTIDIFAKAKVANFLKRSVTDGRDATAPSFEVRKVQTFDNSFEFHARIRVPLPMEYGEVFAEGTAPTEKDAEVVAAMHFERIVDAYGFQLFQLTSKQQKHSDAAKAAGRWAAAPGESPRPPSSVRLPPPLQLVVESTRATVNKFLNDDERQYALVSPGRCFSPLKLTLASPSYLDQSSVPRVRQYFDACGLKMSLFSRVVPLHVMHRSESARQAMKTTTVISSATGKEVWLCQLRLPVDNSFGTRIASGRAGDSKTATILACMHAELIVDALGIALYPSSRAMQTQHAIECERLGRWCTPTTDSSHWKPKAMSPPPLRFAPEVHVADVNVFSSVEGERNHEVGDSGEGSKRFDEELQTHAAAIDALRHVTKVATVDNVAVDDMIAYIFRYRKLPPSSSPFLSESLGVRNKETFRSTLSVPLPRPFAIQGTDVVKKVVVAVGVGPSLEISKQCCAMHGLVILGSLGIPIYTNDSEQEELYHRMRLVGGVAARSASAESMKEFITQNWSQSVEANCIKFSPGDFLGRVTPAGLAAGLQKGLMSDPYSDEAEEDVIRRRQLIATARQQHPRDSWSIAKDTPDGSRDEIVIPPHATVQQSRNYGHTLGSVRVPDGGALTRVRDYFERHGLDFQRLRKITVVNEDDKCSGEREVQVTAFIPVPVAAGVRQAVGIAPTEEEAVICCAMHAELILDAIGVPMYDHLGAQARHAETAASLGRWAPFTLRTSKERATRPSPPPIHKLHESSVQWLRHSRRVHGDSVPVVPQQRDPSSHQESNDPLRPSSASVDDEAFHLPTMTAVAESAIIAQFRDFFFKYCANLQFDADLHMRKYDFLTHDGAHRIYRSIVEIPLPCAYRERLGRRYALGTASSKRNSFFLCCMHAVLVLDSLGVCVMLNPESQTRHVEYQRSRGLVAPLWNGTVTADATTPSPPGLKCLDHGVEALTAPLLPPRRPQWAEVRDPQAIPWVSYLKQCRVFIKSREEAQLHHFLHQLGKAPRCGIALVDAGLDLVEAAPVNVHAKNTLRTTCEKYQISCPGYFSYEAIGRGMQKKYICKQSVLDTPYVAVGFGAEAQTSLCRCMMHYEWLVTVLYSGRELSPAQWGSGAKTPTSNAGARGSSTVNSVSTQLMLLQLYAAVTPPHRPLTLTTREKSHPSGATVKVCLAELHDAVGLKLSGKGEALGDETSSRSRAIAELYKLVAAKNAMQSLAHFIVTRCPCVRFDCFRGLMVEDAGLVRDWTQREVNADSVDTPDTEKFVWRADCPASLSELCNDAQLAGSSPALQAFLLMCQSRSGGHVYLDGVTSPLVRIGVARLLCSSPDASLTLTALGQDAAFFLIVLRNVVRGNALKGDRGVAINEFISSSAVAAEAVWLRLSVLLAAGMRCRCLDAALSIASLLLLQWSHPDGSPRHCRECLEVSNWLRSFNNGKASNQREAEALKKALCEAIHAFKGDFVNIFRRQSYSFDNNVGDGDVLDSAHWGPLSLRTHHATIVELCFATAFASEKTVSLRDEHHLLTCSYIQGQCVGNALENVFTDVSNAPAVGESGANDASEVTSTRKLFCLAQSCDDTLGSSREGRGVIAMSLTSPWVVYFCSHSTVHGTELLYDDVRSNDDVTCLQVVYGVLPLGIVTSAAVPPAVAPVLLSFLSTLRRKFREALTHQGSGLEEVMADVLLVLRQRNRSAIVVPAGSSRVVTIAGRDVVVVGDTIVERCVSADLVPCC